MKYALFLRGINVGGIRVPMKELRSCLEELDCHDVVTYLQSGNVTFNSTGSATTLKSKIESELTRMFKYEAYVLLFPTSLLNSIVERYPFDQDEKSHRYVIFCKDQQIADELYAYADHIYTSREAIAKGDQVVYWQAPKGADSDTFFSKIIAKAKYKALITTRNLNTLEKML